MRTEQWRGKYCCLFGFSLSFGSRAGQFTLFLRNGERLLVGNIAQDLGLDLKRLKSGKARIYTGDSAEYIELNKERGVLLIKERIDRETLCGTETPWRYIFRLFLKPDGILLSYSRSYRYK